MADPNTGVAVYDSNCNFLGQIQGQCFKGWGTVGGTSASAPIIAAVYALAGNGASTTYGSYPYSHTSGLFDVTSGSNGSCGGIYLCTGKPGYDGPTGLGTPNGTSAFEDLDSGSARQQLAGALLPVAVVDLAVLVTFERRDDHHVARRLVVGEPLLHVRDDRSAVDGRCVRRRRRRR